MNSWERVLNTMQGLPVDRVPVFAVLSSYGSKLTNISMQTLYTNADAYCAGQRAVQKAFGVDLVIPPFDYSVVAEAFGGEIAWFTNQAPNMKKPGFKDPQLFLETNLPDLNSAGRFPLMLEITTALALEYKEKVPVFAVIPGPCSLPALIFGLDKWLDILLFDNLTAKAVLEKITGFYLEWANSLLSKGALAVLITEIIFAKEIMSKELLVSNFQQYFKQTTSQIHGPWVLTNTGASINHILDLTYNYSGMVGVTIGSKSSMTEARKILGPEVLIAGNLDNLSFPSLKSDDIYQLSMKCLEEMAPGSHFVLSNSGADIPISTSPESILAMLQASTNYSQKMGY